MTQLSLLPQLQLKVFYGLLHCMHFWRICWIKLYRLTITPPLQVEILKRKVKVNAPVHMNLKQSSHFLVSVLNYLLFCAVADKLARTRKLKHDVIEAINILIEDIDTCHELIAEQAVEHIHQKYLPFARTGKYVFILLCTLQISSNIVAWFEHMQWILSFHCSPLFVVQGDSLCSSKKLW